MVQLPKICHSVYVDAKEASTLAFEQAGKNKEVAKTALSDAFKRSTVVAEGQEAQAPISLKDRACNVAAFAKHATLTIVFAIPVVNALALLALLKMDSSIILDRNLEMRHKNETGEVVEVVEQSEPEDVALFLKKMARNEINLAQVPPRILAEMYTDGLVRMVGQGGINQQYQLTELGEQVLGRAVEEFGIRQIDA